eukprot:766643-Hanusia_phi.AAC.8
MREREKVDIQREANSWEAREGEDSEGSKKGCGLQRDTGNVLAIDRLHSACEWNTAENVEGSLTYLDQLHPENHVVDKHRYNYHNSISAAKELDSYFDNIPTHDVNSEHTGKKIRNHAIVQSADADEEWSNGRQNLQKAINIVQNEGDAALERAVKNGFLSDGPDLSASSRPQQTAGMDGSRARMYARTIGSLKGQIQKEQNLMRKLERDLASSSTKQKSIVKQDDKALDLNPKSEGWNYDQFSNFNPPVYQGPSSKNGARAENAKDVVASAQDVLQKVRAVSQNMNAERQELVNARESVKEAEQLIDSSLQGLGNPKEGDKTQSLRIAKEDDKSMDLNPYYSNGWVYDEFSNFNRPTNKEVEYVPAGYYNSKYGFTTADFPPKAPVPEHGRYGDLASNTQSLSSKKAAVEEQLTRIPKEGDKSLDLNPYWSKGWNYDEFSNYNKPMPKEEMVKPGELNKKYGFTTADFPPKAPVPEHGRYGDLASKQTPKLSAKQVQLAMKRDEKSYDQTQHELKLAQGALAAMEKETLRHHEVAKKDALHPAKEIAWDQKNMIKTTRAKKTVDALSSQLKQRELKLNADVDQMMTLEKAKAGKSTMRWLGSHILHGLSDRAAASKEAHQGAAGYMKSLASAGLCGMFGVAC